MNATVPIGDAFAKLIPFTKGSMNSFPHTPPSHGASKTLVVADRVFDAPVDVEQLWATDSLDLQRLCTYASPDRRRTACVYAGRHDVDVDALADAAGAESVWEAASWCATIGHESTAVDDDRCIVVLQRYFPNGTSAQRLKEGAAKGGFCFEAHLVQPIESYIRLDGKVSMCLFAAPDAESVRNAVRILEIPVVRAWTATPVRPRLVRVFVEVFGDEVFAVVAFVVAPDGVDVGGA